jgi:hypothetical protein
MKCRACKAEIKPKHIDLKKELATCPSCRATSRVTFGVIPERDKGLTTEGTVEQTQTSLSMKHYQFNINGIVVAGFGVIGLLAVGLIGLIVLLNGPPTTSKEAAYAAMFPWPGVVISLASLCVILWGLHLDRRSVTLRVLRLGLEASSSSDPFREGAAAPTSPILQIQRRSIPPFERDTWLTSIQDVYDTREEALVQGSGSVSYTYCVAALLSDGVVHVLVRGIHDIQTAKDTASTLKNALGINR